MRPSPEPDPCRRADASAFRTDRALDRAPDGGADRSADRHSERRDDEINQRFRRYRASGDRALRNALVEDHRWIASVSVRRFAHRGEPLDDLSQVALLGVLKAVERFDPDYGASFPAFALPTVTGELRRHFRDATWALRVSRRAKELHLALAGAIEPLTQELGRPPRLDELAQRLGTSVEDLVEAMEAGNAYRTTPLVVRPGEEGSADDLAVLASDDESLTGAEGRVTVHGVLDALPERERRIVYLRFYGDLTQSEIAEEVGVSQVHVSRLLRSTLNTLRRRLAD